jgi:uncharacterized membrane protein YhaH (DUF805 family)
MNEHDPKPRYWFYAKRYGWGWGLPATWEGWTVAIIWVMTIVGLGSWIATRSMVGYFVFIAVMVTVIVGVCYAKGEPPRWRWGDKQRLDK